MPWGVFLHKPLAPLWTLTSPLETSVWSTGPCKQHAEGVLTACLCSSESNMHAVPAGSPDPCVYETLSLFSHSVVLTLCNPVDCSTLGFPVHHQLLELAQTHVH